MTGLFNSIHRVRSIVQPQSSTRFIRLNGSVGATVTQLVFDQTLSTAGVTEGSVLTPEFRLERIYVLDVDNASTVTDSIRGMDNTYATSLADNTIVRVNERFDNQMIVDVINEEANQLVARGIMEPVAHEFTYAAEQRSYNLPVTGTEGQQVLGVWANSSDTAAKSWVRLRNWRLDHSANTTDFTSGVALVIDEPWTDGETIRVLYTPGVAAIDGADLETANLSDTLTDFLPVPSTAADVLILGAAIRLLEREEGRRNQLSAQGDSRQSAEVPPGAFVSGVQLMRQTYARMVREEQARMRQRYPNLDWESS